MATEIGQRERPAKFNDWKMRHLSQVPTKVFPFELLNVPDIYGSASVSPARFVSVSASDGCFCICICICICSALKDVLVRTIERAGRVCGTLDNSEGIH